MKLLSSGSSFVPTRNKIDITKVHSDLMEWDRRMRLKEYFYDKQVIRKEKTSTFTPAPRRDRWLDVYIDTVKRKDRLKLAKR